MLIVAIKTHAGGDLLLTTPALRALRHGFPDADLILVTGRANAGVARAIPGIAAYLFVDEVALLRRRFTTVINFLRNLKSLRADKTVIFQRSAALARVARLAGGQVFAPYRGARLPRYLAGGAPWVPNGEKYIAENYVEVAEAAGGVRDDLRLDFVISADVADASALTGLSGKKRYVVVAPGGAENPRERVEAKLPPVRQWVEIIDFVSTQSGRDVVIVGGPGDVGRCSEIVAQVRAPVVNLAGRTTVAELGRVISEAAYVITNDSLPLHVAVAFGKPTLVLFGPSNPKALLPPGDKVAAVTAEVDCAPCYANSPFPRCRRPFKFECRERIPMAPIKDWVLRFEKR